MQCWACGRENAPGVRFCAACGAGLRCPDCGAPMSSGQRFCTNCGRRAPVRGAQTVVRRIQRRREDTPHFRIHFTAGSFAEQNFAAVAARLETARGAVVELLALPPEDGLIDVYLSDVIEDPERPGTPIADAGYALPNRMSIYAVFRPDSPGESLERSLVRLLLVRAIGDGAAAATLIEVGVLLLAMQRIGAFPPDDQIAPSLAAARADRSLPPVGPLLTAPPPADVPLYPLAAASFTGFLLRTRGAERVKEFARRLAAGKEDEAARAAFGQAVAHIEKAWHKSLKVATPGGVTRFIRLASVYLRPYKLAVAEILLYIAISVAFTNILARSSQWLFDKALPGPSHPGDGRFLAQLMGGLALALVISFATSLRGDRLQARVAERVLMDMRLRAFSLIQRLHPGFFQQMQTGDILSRLTSDLAAIQFALSGALAQGLQLILVLIVAVITVFWLDWKLALLAMAGLPLFFITTRWLGPAAARASFTRQQHLAGATSVLQENLAAQPVVKAFGLEERVTTGYRATLETLYQSSQRLTFLSAIFGLTANGIASAIQLTVLGVGGWLILRGNLTIGTLVAFTALLAQIIGPVQNLSGLMQALQQASGAMDRVDELLKAQPAIADRPDARPIGPLKQGIRFENVGFSYTGEQPNLRGLNLAIPAGTNVALVGPSGCGKSTTLGLLMRFYDPGQGRVTLDGVDLRDATIASVRGQMGVVFQDTFLFDTSIRENIRLGRPDATDAEVEAAAKAAELHDLILEMPEGYNTTVGERGGRLSGGQRQRVAIARAILRNPSILLLDEATSALDPRTEAAINDTLDRLSRGRTTISVTHRLASVVNADRIFVLDHGGLVEEGTHDELIKPGGLYARLWQEQGGFVMEA